MRSLINLLRNTKIAYIIKRTPLLKSTVKFIYKTIMFPFTRKGIDVNIGGAGSYRLDYSFVFSGYERFGDRHNTGFKRWIECCKNKATVFDIGAHIGLYAIPASNVVAPDGVVYAFEPSETNRRYLKRHLGYNNIHNVIILPYIVGELTEEKQIFYENKDVDPMGSLHPKKNINRYSPVYRKQISLDDFTRDFNLDPDVIKIDVEGSEYNILKGAGKVIKRYHPIVFLSIHPKQLGLFNSSVNELKELIDSLNYIVQDEDAREVMKFEHKEYILTPT